MKDERKTKSQLIDELTDLRQQLAEANRRIGEFETVEAKWLQVEQALRESEARFNETQAVAHVGSWHLDIPNDLLQWSDETNRIFGLSVGTRLTYERFLERVHPEDQEYVDAKQFITQEKSLLLFARRINCEI